MAQIETNLIVNNSATARSDLEKAIKSALWAVGSTAERHAKANAPVVTGRLQNSITHAEDENEKAVVIGSNVEYATAQEFGRGSMPGKHYLQRAISENVDEYKKLVENILKNA